MNPSSFSYLETHRLAHQPGNLVHQSSEAMGWRSLFASVQTEAAYEGNFSAVRDHLLVIPLKQPVLFTRRIGGELQEQTLPPGSTTITPGGADYSIRTAAMNGDGAYDTIHFYIRHDTLEEMHAEMFDTGQSFTLPPFIGVIDLTLQGIALEIRKMLASPAPSDRVHAETLARTLASCLIRRHVLRRPPSLKSAGGLSPQQLSRAIAYIEEYLDQDVSLAEIARAAGVNGGLLGRAFKINTNLTPHEYVVKARVDRAKLLLLSTDLSLAEIALRCGFSHQQHMTRMVRRVAGLTPGALRRSAAT